MAGIGERVGEILQEENTQGIDTNHVDLLTLTYFTVLAALAHVMWLYPMLLF